MMEIHSVEPDIIEHYPDEIYCAFLIREVEQRLLDLFEKGRLFGTVHTAVGQEFSGVSVLRNATEEDYVFSNHRCHGHFIAYSKKAAGLIAELMGKKHGVCGGRGGSQHLQYERFFSNGIQSGSTAISAGVALAGKINGRSGGISIIFIGDGTTGEGLLYEAMNICSIWSLPVLFVCENNYVAQSTDTERTISGSILDRPKAFSIESRHSNTWDVPTLMKDVEESVSFVRRNGRPLFHLIDTYRLNAHSKGDDLRDIDTLSEYAKRDPLNIILRQFSGDERIKGMRDRAEQVVNEAVEIAENDVFGNVDISSPDANFDAPRWVEHRIDSARVVESVNSGLRYGLENRKAVLIGEDIEDPYGGAFKCTRGLSEEFPTRVLNTPISEAAIVGVGTGLALSGYIPVVEIMFADFLTLAFDQWLNHAAKMEWMYNHKVKVPLVIRTPSGGKRGYAATHSQSIEKHFLGVPGTKVVCLHHRYSPTLVYKELFDSIDEPTLVIENKILYGARVNDDVIPGYGIFRTETRFPTVNIRPSSKPDVTVVAIGGISQETENALNKLVLEDEILCDLFLPTQLYPFDVRCLLESLSDTRKLLVADEGQPFASISSEIVALISEIDASLIDKFGRVCAKPWPIPSSRILEEESLPHEEHIYSAVLKLLR